MTESIARHLRRARRLLGFLTAALNGLRRHGKLPRDASRAQSAEWLHYMCARGLRAIDVQLEVEGRLPERGLIVSNHLSYVDILVYSAAARCVFVSKAEVEGWPLFGRFTRWSGSVFVRRHDRQDAARANASITAILDDGVPLVLFPEGTTTSGESVLRFHATMLQPAIDAGAPITPCAIDYALDDGDPAREVCWWGEMALLPHAWNLLGKRAIRARIRFAEPIVAMGDRKELSQLLRNTVVRMRAELQDNGGRGLTELAQGTRSDRP